MKKFILLNFLFLSILSFGKQGYLGVVVNDVNDQKVKGVLISDVIDNGAADRFGIHVNDIVTAVNDVAVINKEDLIKTLATFNYGDKVKITYERNNRLTNDVISLGNKPEPFVVKVTKQDLADGEHWSFDDYKVELVVKGTDNTPVSVITRFDNKLKIGNNFNDFKEQLTWISKIKNNANKCSCNCPISQFTFYKIEKDETPAEVKTVASNNLFMDRFSLSPNPSTGRVKVDLASNEKGTPSITIFDVNGEVVQTDMLQNFVGEYSKEYNLEGLAKGTYMMQLKIGDKLTTKKFVLQ